MLEQKKPQTNAQLLFDIGYVTNLCVTSRVMNFNENSSRENESLVNRSNRPELLCERYIFILQEKLRFIFLIIISRNDDVLSPSGESLCEVLTELIKIVKIIHSWIETHLLAYKVRDCVHANKNRNSQHYSAKFNIFTLILDEKKIRKK